MAVLWITILKIQQNNTHEKSDLSQTNKSEQKSLKAFKQCQNDTTDNSAFNQRMLNNTSLVIAIGNTPTTTTNQMGSNKRSLYAINPIISTAKHDHSTYFQTSRTCATIRLPA